MFNNDKLPLRMLLFVGVITSLVVAILFLLVELCYFSITEELQNAAAASGKNTEKYKLADTQRAQIGSYRWIDKDKKTVKLPIDRAIEVVVKEQGN